MPTRLSVGRILFGLWLVALAASPPAVLAQGPRPSSSVLVTSDPRAQYFVVKRTMQQLYDQGVLRGNAGGGRSYDLYHRTRGSEYLGQSYDKREPIAALADLGSRVVIWRNDLRKLGYPEAVWRPLLVEVEDAQLDLRLKEQGRPWSESLPSERHLAASMPRIAAALNRYRRESNPGLPELIVEGGCGAGEVGVKIATEPRGGRVTFIPVFFYELCKAQQLNPDDPARCDRWREAVDGVLFDVAGDYFYHAQWSDGIARRGRLSFTTLTNGQTVVFRKP